MLPSSSGLKMALPVVLLMRVPSAKAASVSSTPHAAEPERNPFSSSVMFDLLFCSAAAGEGLRGAACAHKHEHRHRHDGDEDGQQHRAHLGPKLHDARSGGHEQQREDAGEEQPHLLDLLALHDAEAERRQQKQQAVDAGRDGEGQQGVTDLAQKTEREDARELKQMVRRDASFGLKETRDYIMEYKSTV